MTFLNHMVVYYNKHHNSIQTCVSSLLHQINLCSTLFILLQTISGYSGIHTALHVSLHPSYTRSALFLKPPRRGWVGGGYLQSKPWGITNASGTKERKQRTTLFPIVPDIASTKQYNCVCIITSLCLARFP